jgi:8-oxo-dGTP diphosphatase
MKNLILLIVSAGLTIALGLFLLVFGIICCSITQSLPSYYIRLAIAIDAMGNVLGYPLFNLIMIKKGGYKFGNRRNTISYVLGMNKMADKLWGVGIPLAWVLNKLDKDHLEKAIGLI